MGNLSCDHKGPWDPFSTPRLLLPNKQGLFDVDKELARLRKQQERLEKERAALEARLARPGFADKAPTAVVAEVRGALAEAGQQLAAVQAKIQALESQRG